MSGGAVCNLTRGGEHSFAAALLFVGRITLRRRQDASALALPPLPALARHPPGAERSRRLPYSLVEERPWEWRQPFLAINPAGELPVLELSDGPVIAGCYAISEFLPRRWRSPQAPSADASAPVPRQPRAARRGAPPGRLVPRQDAARGDAGDRAGESLRAPRTSPAIGRTRRIPARPAAPTCATISATSASSPTSAAGSRATP